MKLNFKRLFKFSDYSIKNKLVTFTMATTLVSLFLAMSAIISLDRTFTKRNMLEEVDTLSQILAARSEVAINFGDKRNSQSNLDALKNSPEYMLGCIYSATEQLLGEYPLDHNEKECPKALPKNLASMEPITDHYIHLWTPVYRNGQDLIGYLYLQRSLEALSTRLTRFMAASIFIFGLVLVAGYIGISRLQRIISKPILDLAELAKKIAQSKNYQLRAQVKTKDEVGVLGEGFNFMLDITEKQQKNLEFIAFHDALTGLPNRRYFMETLERNLTSVQRGHRAIALFLIDLDGFKGVNDTIGHDAGDMVLETVSERMPQVLRKSDMISRLGGDEFTIILSDISTPETIRRIALQLIKKIEEPITFKGQRADVSASIGIAMAPSDAVEMEVLLKLADAAMYRAKAGGKRTFYFYDEELDARMKAYNSRETILFSKLQQNHVELLYQPFISTHEKTVQGMLVILNSTEHEEGEEPFSLTAYDTSTIRHIANLDIANLMLTKMIELIESDIKVLGTLPHSEHPLRVILPVTNRQLRHIEHKEALIKLAQLLEINGLELKLSVDRGGFENEVDEQLRPHLVLSDDGSGVENLGSISPNTDWCLSTLPHGPASEWDWMTWKNMMVSAEETNTSIISIGVKDVGQLQFCRKLGIALISGDYISTPLLAPRFVDWCKQSPLQKLKLS
ncbi:MAG: diguanylate cyclase [Pseudomonadota bacterium]|nr:diguanylate cyclase [Pseudomonadota bacterium]